MPAYRAASAASKPHRLLAGERFAPRRLVGVDGKAIVIPDADRIVHLQLRRFAGCPICNLHLRSFRRFAEEIEAAGIREVIVFHSTVKELGRYAPDIPFTLVADPERRIYRELGVERSLRSLLDPRAYVVILRGLLVALLDALRDKAPPPALAPTGGRLGLPADLLIAPDGLVLAVKYGLNAYDQWSVGELLDIVESNPGSRRFESA